MALFGCCAKSCAVLALLLALLGGWASTYQHPLGLLFIAVFKLRGLGKPLTEPVPDGLRPSPRPEGELFLELPGGDRMPANGIGMCCRPTAYDPESVRRTVLWFLLQGGRHIDTASMYMNHASVGQGIRDAAARGVPREEVFLVTKVWSDNFGYEAAVERTRQMARELGVDYIDLVLLHVPVKVDPAMMARHYYSKFVGGGVDIKLSNTPEHLQLRRDTWRALSMLRDEGLVRNVGVSNFNIDHMEQIQDLGLAPIAAHQLQYHPWAPQWMQDVVSYCHRHRIAVTAYFSLGGTDKKDKALDVAALNEVAKAHGRRPAQILLRWSLQKNVSVIPGTGSHKHMADNLATYGFALSDADMARLDSMATLPISKDFMFFEF